MKAGKITAKLRDAVKVCFMVEGEEVKRYKNIEMPDALKELEIWDFGFNVLTDGKIEFWLHFDQGILPEEWPDCRERKTRSAKVETGTIEATEAPAMPEAGAAPTEATEALEQVAEPMEVLEVDVAPVVKDPAKRGRKPGRRANTEPQPEKVAIRKTRPQHGKGRHWRKHLDAASCSS